MLERMRRTAWPLASTLLVLSACNALTGVSDLATCDSCDEHPELDAGGVMDARAPETSVGDSAALDAGDSATKLDADATADADADAGIGCQGAVACERVVFVTSLDYSGNLGGIAGADAKCQALADQSSIARIKGRTFLAWVSTSMTPASVRMVHGTQPYVLGDCTTIAASWSDLTDGNLQNGISVDQLGGNQGGSAWTGTNSTNASFGGASCADWTSMALGMKGVGGNVGGNGGGWSNGGIDDCGLNHNLYCFEK